MRKLLVLSLALNLTFIVAGALFLYRKGGWAYLRNQRTLITGRNVGIDDFPLYYQQRYSDFRGHPLPPAATVLVGDSLTEMGDWAHLLDQPVVNRGIGADTTVGLRYRLPDLVQPCPSRLFVLIGISDLRIGRSVSRIVETYDTILGELRGRCPATRLLVESVLPINHERFGREIAGADIVALNRALQELAARRGATFLDLHDRFATDGELRAELTTDGVHLSPAGYALWAGLLREHL